MRRASAPQHIQHHLIRAPDASARIDEHKRAPQLPPAGHVLLDLLPPLLSTGETITRTIHHAQAAGAAADEIPRYEVLGRRTISPKQGGAEAGLGFSGDAGGAVLGGADAEDVHDAGAAGAGADEGEFAAAAAAAAAVRAQQRVQQRRFARVAAAQEADLGRGGVGGEGPEVRCAEEEARLLRGEECVCVFELRGVGR